MTSIAWGKSNIDLGLDDVGMTFERTAAAKGGDVIVSFNREEIDLLRAAIEYYDKCRRP